MKPQYFSLPYAENVLDEGLENKSYKYIQYHLLT